MPPDAVCSELQPNHDRVADPIETVISRTGLGMLWDNRGHFHEIDLSAERPRRACLAFNARGMERGIGAGWQGAGL
jgi:hypothetical protein